MQPAIRGKLEGMRATARFKNLENYRALVKLLEANHHFQFAVEQLDRVSAAYKRRHGVTLPKPEELFQNPNCTICVCWPDLAVFCARDFVAWRVGGVGEPITRMHPEVNGVPDELVAAIHIATRLVK